MDMWSQLRQLSIATEGVDTYALFDQVPTGSVNGDGIQVVLAPPLMVTLAPPLQAVIHPNTIQAVLGSTQINATLKDTNVYVTVDMND